VACSKIGRIWRSHLEALCERRRAVLEFRGQQRGRPWCAGSEAGPEIEGDGTGRADRSDSARLSASRRS